MMKMMRSFANRPISECQIQESAQLPPESSLTLNNQNADRDRHHDDGGRDDDHGGDDHGGHDDDGDDADHNVDDYFGDNGDASGDFRFFVGNFVNNKSSRHEEEDNLAYIEYDRYVL